MQSQNDGAIAQLVEQRTENPCVPGSIPGGTTQKSLAEMQGFFGLWLFPRPLPSTKRVSFVDELFLLAPSVHKKGIFCGCTVLFGPFRPQKGYLLWRSCSRWPLPSTKRVSFVDALFSLAASVHKKGIFCGCTVLFGPFRPQKRYLLWMSWIFCTLCPRQRYPVWRECIPKCFIPIGFVTQGMVRLTISASADVR